MTNENDFSPERLAKLRNLKPYRDKTDEEIIAHLKSREPKLKVITATTGPKEKSYDSRFNEKKKILLKEFEIDMNTSNDMEALNALVRSQIQLENVGKEIETLQTQEHTTKDDMVKLKSLGDFQRSVITSINDLQDKMGITRKIRKEKAVDDIPQWIDGVLERAKEFYDTKTVKVECPKCVVELYRYWLNFPKEENRISLELTCWKCKEKIMHIG